MISFDPPIVAGTTLVRDAIQSQNYTPNTAGWIVEADGDAEFNNLTFRGTFRGNEIIINADGIFLYNGTPALNSIVGSWASVDGTDEFGNAYHAGFSLYDGTTGTITNYIGGPDNLMFNIQGSEYVGMSIGNLILSADGDPFGPNLLNHSGQLSIIGDNSAIVLSSPTNSQFGPPFTLDEDAVFWIVAGESTAAQGSVKYPHTLHQSTDAWHYGANIKARVNPGTGFPTLETWHTVGTTGNPAYSGTYASATTFNGTAGFPPLQYRLDAEDNVWVYGCFIAGASPGTDVFMLPVGYRPKTVRAQLPVNFFDASAGTVRGGFVQVLTAGNVSVGSGTSILGTVPAVGDIIFVNGKFPIGNLA